MRWLLTVTLRFFLILGIFGGGTFGCIGPLLGIEDDLEKFFGENIWIGALSLLTSYFLYVFDQSRKRDREKIRTFRRKLDREKRKHQKDADTGGETL